MASLVECVRALLRCLTMLLIDIVLVLADLIKIFTRDAPIPLDLVASEEHHAPRIVLARRSRLLLLVCAVFSKSVHTIASTCGSL